MNRLRRLILCASMAAALPLAGAQAQNANQQIPIIDGPTYVTNYVEVVPSAAARAITILKEYRDASRKEPGARFIDVLQEDGSQTHRFVLSEVWDNRGAVLAHEKNTASMQLSGKLKGIALGPPDARVHQAHAVTPPRAASAGDVVILSHVDVFGGNVQKLIALLNTLSDASRKDPGMVRYEVLDEVPAHPNHFRILEEWASPAAWEAHNLSPHSQSYREALMPMLGTPYDQRVYRLVN